jgi:hypothetical protein
MKEFASQLEPAKRAMKNRSRDKSLLRAAGQVNFATMDIGHGSMSLSARKRVHSFGFPGESATISKIWNGLNPEAFAHGCDG